jgi:hypothetical protein
MSNGWLRLPLDKTAREKALGILLMEILLVRSERVLEKRMKRTDLP